jgi:hypothetical protein
MSDRKRSRLEVASWIGGIAGALIALVALIVDMRSKSGEAHTGKEPPEKIAQTQATGTQIGQATGSVTIYNTPPVNAANPKSEEAKVVLAAFNLDDEHGYFKETSPSTFESTNRYGRLALCADTRKYKTSQNYRKLCGDVGNLTPVFDVTLTVASTGNVVLNGIAATATQVTQMVEGGEGATVPKATIPVSAKYVIDLPAQQEGRDNEGTVRVAAIPPLLISEGQPARFQIAVRHHCVNECTAILTLAFGLSTKQSLSTNEIRFDFGHDVPEECVNFKEDLVDRCVADWDRKAQQEDRKRESEDKAYAAFEAKAAQYLKAAGIKYTDSDLFRLWEKGVKPQDVVAAIDQARSSNETRP